MDHSALWLQHIMRMQFSGWPSQERITGTWTTCITTLIGHHIYILKMEQLVFFRSSFLIEALPFRIYSAFSWMTYSVENPILQLGTEEAKKVSSRSTPTFLSGSFGGKNLQTFGHKETDFSCPGRKQKWTLSLPYVAWALKLQSDFGRASRTYTALSL